MGRFENDCIHPGLSVCTLDMFVARSWWMWACVLALVTVGHHSGHNGTALFQDCRCCSRHHCHVGDRNSSNNLIAYTRTKQKQSKRQRDRQSVHDPVVTVAVIFIIVFFLKTNFVGRDRTTEVAAAFLVHSCRWSFVPIVNVVVVAVALGEFIIVTDSLVLL